MWSPCSDDGHDWKYIDEWTGRYRCQKPECGVIGYKAAAVLPPDVVGKRRLGILTYKCPTCHGPTTKFKYKRVGEYRGRNGSQVCPACLVQRAEVPA